MVQTHKVELDVRGLYNYSLTCFNTKKEYKKKELKGADWLVLIGAAAHLARNNEYDIRKVLDSSAFCDDELYFNDFFGYQLSRRLNLKSLYLTEGGRVIASVYDRKKDRFINFITW